MTTPTTPVPVPDGALIAVIHTGQRRGLLMSEIAAKLGKPLSTIHDEVNAWLRGFKP